DPPDDRRGGSQRGNGGIEVVMRAFRERRMAPGRMRVKRGLRTRCAWMRMDGTRAMTAGRELQHIPVMREAVLAGLAVRPGGRYLDGTFGRGGHARAILDRLDADGRLLVMDRDPQAIAHAQREFGGDPRVAIRQANFSEVTDWDAACGFSFQSDAPLDMRMDPTTGESAATFLANADEREIADVLFRYGEERMS